GVVLPPKRPATPTKTPSYPGKSADRCPTLNCPPRAVWAQSPDRRPSGLGSPRSSEYVLAHLLESGYLAGPHGRWLCADWSRKVYSVVGFQWCWHQILGEPAPAGFPDPRWCARAAATLVHRRRRLP